MSTRPLPPAPTTRFLLLITLLTALFGSLLISRVRSVGDEDASLPRIRSFLAGDWSVQENLAVPPTYHPLIAGIARLCGVSSLDGLRLISLLCNLPIMAFFSLCPRKIDPATASIRTLQ